MNELEKRFVKPRRKWVAKGSTRRKWVSIVFTPARLQAIDERAKRLSAELGREVNRSMVINDLVQRDADIQRIEKEVSET